MIATPLVAHTRRVRNTAKIPAARPPPENPMVSESSWSAAVYNDHKESRATMTPNARSATSVQSSKPSIQPVSKPVKYWDTQSQC